MAVTSEVRFARFGHPQRQTIRPTTIALLCFFCFQNQTSDTSAVKAGETVLGLDDEMAATPRVVKLVPNQTAFLFCDLQTKFRMQTLSLSLCASFVDLFPSEPAIYGFDSLVATGNKLIQVAKVPSIFSALMGLAYKQSA
jgi:hypothetical protein